MFTRAMLNDLLKINYLSCSCLARLPSMEPHFINMLSTAMTLLSGEVQRCGYDDNLWKEVSASDKNVIGGRLPSCYWLSESVLLASTITDRMGNQDECETEINSWKILLALRYDTKSINSPMRYSV
ncbi:hypothetical protein LIA77_10282 [Sarocladium implicatum]|nr:hypothetical protein LIA77_10282 [Sarocladium implicatum]